MRKLSLLLQLCCTAFLLQAQQDTLVNLDSIFPLPADYLDEKASIIPCPSPSISVIAPIYYNDRTEVFLQFDQLDETTNSTLQIKQLDALGGFNIVSPTESKLVLGNLEKEKDYEILAYDFCGKPVTISFSTKREQDEILSLSPTFFNLISEYLRTPNGRTFDEFVLGLDEVSQYEKISFLQRFFFKNTTFSPDIGLNIPVIPDRGNSDTCFCNMIRTVQAAEPAKQNYDTGIINSEIDDEFSEDKKLRISELKNTHQWQDIHNRGSAKWHTLFTRGSKVTPGVDHYVPKSWVDSTLISSQTSYLSIALICMDDDRVPKECECEKQIICEFRYDTEVKTAANVINPPWWSLNSNSRNALAQVEDMAIAYRWERNLPNSFKPLDMTIARSVSRCDRIPNPDFWLSQFELAQSAVKLQLVGGIAVTQQQTLGFFDTQSISNALDDFFIAFDTAITTPPTLPSNCTQGPGVTASMLNSDTFSMRPNSPVTYAISSYGKLSAGGRYHWDSHARINSNAYLAARLSSNGFDGTPLHCCSPRVGVWVGSSCNGPLSTDAVKRQVHEFFWLHGFPANLFTPSNASSTGYTMKWEFGWMSAPSTNPLCNRITINDGGVMGTRSDESGQVQSPSSIFLWSISGQLMATLESTEILSEKHLKELIEQRFSHLPSGMYIIQTVQDGITKSEKIIIE